MSRNRVSLLVAAFALISCEALFPHDANPDNCVLNPTLCDGAKGMVCNATTQSCQMAGACSAIAQCESASAVDCKAGQCVACAVDTQCIVWSTDRQVSPARRYCAIPTGASGGTCGECKSNANCASDPAGTFCDATTLKCRGCLVHSECDSAMNAGDGICRRPGDPSTVGGTVGQCLNASTIAYLGNSPVGCVMSGTTSSPAAPYCNLAAAMGSGKAVIKVLPSSTPYPAIALTNQSVTLIGPGRDANPGASFPSVDLNGTGTLTLSDVTVSASGGTAAVQCRGRGSMNIIASSISGSVTGIAADDCATLTVERSRISTPARLAVQVGGTGATTYRIVNSVIVDSGSGSLMNPIRLGISASGEFNYNTVTRSVGSVLCLNGQELKNSILVNNGGILPSGCTAGSSVTDDAVTLDTGPEPKLQSSQAARDKCIDKGMTPPQGEVQTDYFGKQRPLGKGWDKGYHELE